MCTKNDRQYIRHALIKHFRIQRTIFDCFDDLPVINATVAGHLKVKSRF
jgi:hypothetical protein